MFYVDPYTEITQAPLSRNLEIKRLEDSLFRELVQITNAKTIASVPEEELVEQVAFVISELLPKYECELSPREMKAISQSLSLDLLYASDNHQNRRTIH